MSLEPPAKHAIDRHPFKCDLAGVELKELHKVLLELCPLCDHILMKKLMGPDLTEVVQFAQEGNAGITLTDLFPGKRIQELCSPSSEQVGKVTSLMRLCGILMQAIN